MPYVSFQGQTKPLSPDQCFLACDKPTRTDDIHIFNNTDRYLQLSLADKHIGTLHINFAPGEESVIHSDLPCRSDIPKNALSIIIDACKSLGLTVLSKPAGSSESIQQRRFEAIYKNQGLTGLIPFIIKNNYRLSYTSSCFIKCGGQRLSVQINPKDFASLDTTLKDQFKQKFLKDTGCEEKHFPYQY